MSETTRATHQAPTLWQRFVAAAIRILDGNVVGPIARLIRDRRDAAHAGHDHLVVTPIAAAELATVFYPSDNGGVYQRRCKCVIAGAWPKESTVETQQPGIPLHFGIAVIDNAIICGEGVVWKKTANGPRVVEESLATATSARAILPLTRSDDKILRVDPDVRVRKLPSGQPYALLRQPWDNNYGHWIIESLPKVAILAEHYDVTKLKYVITRHSLLPPASRMRKVCADSLAVYGIRPDQIVEVGREALEVDELLYCLPLTTHPWTKAARTIRILEDLRDKFANGQKGPRRVYSSRSTAGRRRLLNEPDILRVLEDFDVTIVDPGVMSFADQVRAFADAELVIGNFGANITNTVFAPRGVTLFAVTSHLMGENFFWDLANLKDGKYFSLHGQGVTADLNTDFVIDPDEFRAFLKDEVLRG
jgi:capsular polysaccharide biosynthesis protein